MTCLQYTSLNYVLYAGNEEYGPNSLMSMMMQGTWSKNSKVLNEGNANMSLKEQDLEQSFAKAFLACTNNPVKQKCSICPPNPEFPDNSCRQSAEEPSGLGGEDKPLALTGGEDNSLALVPVQKEVVACSSISMLIKELPELKPGWPLLRRATLSDRKAPDRSLVRQISVVQWALRLPSRHYSFSSNSDHKKVSCHQSEDQSSSLDSESGAIVPVGTETLTPPPDYNSKRLPKELEGFHEKYSSTCRLFNYEELVSATSKFLTGLAFIKIRT